VKRIRKSRRWWSYEEFIFTVQQHFIEYGYRQTRIDDIAMEMEIPKGTVYRYAQSKEALFWLALRWAGQTFSARPHRSRPIPAPSKRSLQRHVLRRLEDILAAPGLIAPTTPLPLEEARAEFRAALAGIYARLFEHRTAIRLIQRCAHEHPSLQDLYLRPRKKPAVARIAQFLAAHREYLWRHSDPAVLARVSYAAVAFLAVYRKWNAGEIMIRRTRAIRDAVLNSLVEGMLQAPKPFTFEDLELRIAEQEELDDFAEFERMEAEAAMKESEEFSLLKWLTRPYPDQWDVVPTAGGEGGEDAGDLD
jgi:AcrR family transcriptional regulator